jgi:nitrate/nitrite transporter NarK
MALRELFSNGSFILLVLCFTLPAMAAWIVRDWMPAILKTQFNIGQGKAGVSATLFVNLASLGGAVLGGWLADRWIGARFVVGSLSALLGCAVSFQRSSAWECRHARRRGNVSRALRNRLGILRLE